MATVTELEKMTFDNMVSMVAHAAAMELMQGVAWRSIFYTAAMSVCMWKAAQDESRKRIKKHG